MTADVFNAANLQRLTHALSSHIQDNAEYGFEGADYRRYIKGRGKGPKQPLVVVGYDTRFMSENFARLVSDTLASHAIVVRQSNAEAPVPAVACAVVDTGAVGGVTITASEGPSHLNGLKWTPFWGGPAIPEITDDIELRMPAPSSQLGKASPRGFGVTSALVDQEDLREGYFSRLGSIIDGKTIRKAKLRVGTDPLFGSTRTYLRPFMEAQGAEALGIHENRDVLFGGKAPYTGPDSLAELSRFVVKNKLNIGLACDSDGDRFGIIDETGSWVSPNEILALVVEHLVKNRGMKGRVCRNVFTSHFVDAVARTHGLEVRETPVGFKFIGELMRSGLYLLGGEESGGLSIGGHVPDKDGMLACALMTEMLAFEKKPLSKIRQELHKKFGEFNTVKTSVSSRDMDLAGLMEELSVKPPLDLAGFSVWRIDQTDGFKFILRDGSWLGLHPSGTEPVVRIYAEATSKPKLDKLVEEGKKILQGKK